jgi:hypothetical protein
VEQGRVLGEAQECSHLRGCGIQSPEKLRSVVNRKDVVYTVSKEGQGGSHQRECGIQSAEKVRGLVTKENVVCSQQRGSGV